MLITDPRQDIWSRDKAMVILTLVIGAIFGADQALVENTGSHKITEKQHFECLWLLFFVFIGLAVSILVSAFFGAADGRIGSSTTRMEIEQSIGVCMIGICAYIAVYIETSRFLRFLRERERVA